MTFILGMLLGALVGYVFRAAWMETTEADRLEAMRGRPKPRRHNEGSHLPWWEQ